LALARGIEQTAISKLLVFVYSHGRLVTTGRYYGKAERDENSLLWFKFQRRDDIRQAWQKADTEIPTK